MVDVEAAIGYVVAHGDPVDRARLSWLRSGTPPSPEVLTTAEIGQTATGGWPAFWAGDVASVDATCFRLAELDDLGALHRPASRSALSWLRTVQRPDGTWQEDQLLAEMAPAWAVPGDPEATLYLTTNAAFTLVVGGPSVAAPSPQANAHAEAVARATQAFQASVREDGSWPSFLVTGSLGAALLFHAGWFYEAARVQVVLGERIGDMQAADLGWLAVCLRKVGMSTEDFLVAAAIKRLGELQGTDGGWREGDQDSFDVHTALCVLRAVR